MFCLVLVRDAELLRQVDEVAAQLGKLGGKVPFSTGKADHLIYAATGLHRTDSLVDLLHPEQVLQERVGVGEVLATFVCEDVGAVPVADTETSRIELGDDEVTRLGCAATRSPSGNDKAQFGFGAVVAVSGLEDDSSEAKAITVESEDVASLWLHTATPWRLRIEDDELVMRTASADRGIRTGRTRRDVSEAVVLDLGQGQDAASDRLDARCEGVAVLRPLSELALSRITSLGSQSPRVEGIPASVTEGAVDVLLDLGRERSSLDKTLERSRIVSHCVLHSTNYLKNMLQRAFCKHEALFNISYL